MSCLGNLIWFLVGGVWQGLSWLLAGLLWCITIVGIPIGLQCFKFASLAFFPFGKEVRYGGGAVSTIVNIIWLLISGIPLAITAVLDGLLLCVTIIGIPFGLQCFKMAKLALMPFGAEIVS
ncbi:MAG: YccF domain-containing protein [Oscillospiraceae bacterium]|nr:YccF domain-containing protein [Oscillospiraceae bacterium]MDY2509501.1 YccF domain-containing protein [Ruminococcus callidus]